MSPSNITSATGITLDDMVRARLRIYARHPYFSAALSRMVLTPDEKVDISAVDAQWNMHYNPKASYGHKKELDCEAILYHELFHLLGEHFKRGEVIHKREGKKFNPLLWNVAGDYEMYATMKEVAAESDLFLSKSISPPDQLPETYLAEDYYEFLKKQSKQTGVSQLLVSHDCGNHEAKSQGQGEGQGKGKDAGQDAGGGLTEQEKEELDKALQETKDAIERAFPGAKGLLNGKMPGTEAKEFVKLPVILSSFRNRSWVGIIRREITEHMRYRTQGFSRPARRPAPDKNLILMGKKLTDPHITFLVDVSGSIQEAAANEAFAVIDTLKGWNVRFRTFACDTRAKEIRPGDHVYSGGGTDLQRGLDMISQRAPETELCIVISDGQTNWSWQAPAYPVVMFTWDEDGPEWMKTVRMPALIGEVD